MSQILDQAGIDGVTLGNNHVLDAGAAGLALIVGNTGSAIRYMASLPLDTNVLFMTIKATNMPYEGRG